MSVIVASAPGEILPTSLLVSSGFSLTTNLSRTRYLPPTSQGIVEPGMQDRLGPPTASPAPGSSGAPRTLARTLPRRVALPGELLPAAKLFLCRFTTSMPSKFTGSSRRSPSPVSGLIQPKTPVSEQLTSALRRAAHSSVPSSMLSSSTTTSCPGSTSPTSLLERLGSWRTVAGFFTLYRAFISQEPSSRLRTSEAFSLVGSCNTIHPGFKPSSSLSPLGTMSPTSLHALISTAMSSTSSFGCSTPRCCTRSRVLKSGTVRCTL
mmetsp:Transcript_101112/g.321045  ORF Transcript_101112/g.321045 Transcript_101112/m.321045 type:complete len:264 (-) Transcript_101112:134-925(-)